MTAPADRPATRSALPPWRQRLEAFWRWWSAEITRLIPQRFGGLTGTARAPLVVLDGDTLVLVEMRGTALAELSRAPLASLDFEGRRLTLRNLLAGAGETQMRVRLCLGRDESLLRRVSLPLATEENLAQVLAFEMDRLSPFRAEDVYFGFRVAARDSAAAKVHVDLAMAKRDLVDERVQKLRDWGASVQGVVPADDAARTHAPIDLLPEAQRGEREAGGARRMQLGLAVAVLALFAIVLAFPLWHKRETVIGLMPLLAKAKTEAEGTDTLAKELERQVGDYNFLLSKKHGTQPVLAFVEELSRLLPDSTWLQTLEVRPVGKVREVQITGETVSSSKLIELLEQSSTLRNAAPRGAFTRGSQPGTERFLIAAEAKPRALPEPVPAAATPGAAPPLAAQPPANAAQALPAPAATSPPPAIASPPATAPASGPATPAPSAPAPAPAKVTPVPSK